MKIDTKYFGEMEFLEEETLTFPEGMPGFEDHHSYALIRFDNEDDSLLSLQSLDNPELAFVVVNPFYVESAYEPRLTDDDLAVLHSNHDTALAFYAIAVIREPFSETTVNLKCPLAVNPDNRLAMQVVMEDQRYSMRHPLVSGKED